MRTKTLSFSSASCITACKETPLIPLIVHFGAARNARTVRAPLLRPGAGTHDIARARVPSAMHACDERGHIGQRRFCVFWR
jgi:hypothetical protein